MYGHRYPPQQHDEFIFEPPPPPPRVPEKRRPLIRLACPSCGGIVSVNALDRIGQTENTCPKCEGTIWVDTDDEGAITGIEGQEKEGKSKGELDWRSVAIGAVLMLVVIGALYLMSKAVPALPTQPSAPAGTGQSVRPQG